MLAKFLIWSAIISFLGIVTLIAAYQVAYLLIALAFVVGPVALYCWRKSREEARGGASRRR